MYTGKFGSDNPRRYYVGRQEVRRIYLGTALVYNRPPLKLYLDAGVYELSGFALGFQRTYDISLEAGAYAITGFEVNRSQSFTLELDSGSYAIIGQELNVGNVYSISLESGSYVIDGGILLQSDPPPDGEITNISLSSLTSDGTSLTIGTLSTTGGTGPYTYTIV